MEVSVGDSVSGSWAFGLDLGGTALKYGLVSDAGTLIRSRAVPTGAAEGRDAVIDRLRMAVAALREDAAEEGITVEKGGLGCPGTVDAGGTLTGALPNVPALRGIPIVALLEEITGLPCAVDNDANAMVLAEAVAGAGQGLDPVLGVTVGTGIGAGIVIGGVIYRGLGAAGELGHVRMVPEGRPCPCGGRGCLEQYASGSALTRLHCERTGDDLDARELTGRWQHGDADAAATIEAWAQSLARGIGIALTLLHPACLVIGGGVMEAGEPLVSLLNREIRRACLGIVVEDLVVRRAKLGTAAGVIGAGLLAFRTGAGRRTVPR